MWSPDKLLQSCLLQKQQTRCTHAIRGMLGSSRPTDRRRPIAYLALFEISYLSQVA